MGLPVNSSINHCLKGKFDVAGRMYKNLLWLSHIMRGPIIKKYWDNFNRCLP